MTRLEGISSITGDATTGWHMIYDVALSVRSTETNAWVHALVVHASLILGTI